MRGIGKVGKGVVMGKVKVSWAFRFELEIVLLVRHHGVVMTHQGYKRIGNLFSCYLLARCHS